MGNGDAAEALSGRTIHHRIETGQLDRDLGAGRTQYAPRSRPTHKLDRYKGIIEARLAEFPRLSAQRLFDEVRAARYEGSYGRVRDLVRSVRPRQPVAAAVRFETPLGRHRAKWTSARSRCRGAGDMPTVSSVDQGQGGASDSLSAGELLLRS